MSQIKHALYRAVSRVHAALGSGEPPPGLRVLLYHAVGTILPSDPYGTSIAADVFRGHMELLASLRDRWEPAPFGPPVEAAPRCSLTFDDGYRDVLTVAAPLLAASGLPFTVFVTTGFVRGGSRDHLSPAELKELSQMPGVRIGAHGVTHRPLTRLDDARLREELSASRSYLEDALGRPVTCLSYPYGAVDRRVRDAAAAAGYAAGGTSRYGANRPGRDPLLLCRTEITAWDSVRDIELKVGGHWDWYRLRHGDPASDSAPQYC